jgi:hypothetical protein
VKIIKGLKNKAITLVATLIFTIGMTINVYANPTAPPRSYDYLGLFWSFDIIFIVCIVAIIILVKIRNKK